MSAEPSIKYPFKHEELAGFEVILFAQLMGGMSLKSWPVTGVGPGSRVLLLSPDEIRSEWRLKAATTGTDVRGVLFQSHIIQNHANIPSSCRFIRRA